MENRLAVAADERDFLLWNPELATRGQGGVGEEFSQTKIQLAESTRSGGVLFGDAENFLAKSRRELDRRVAQQLSVQTWRPARDSSKRNVNPVRGCSGHETEDE